MRKLFVILVCTIMVFCMMSGLEGKNYVLSADKLFSIQSYTGAVDIGYSGSNGGLFAMEFTMLFDVLKPGTISKFVIATPQNIAVEKVEIDGKTQNVKTDQQYYITLTKPLELGIGKHTAHLKYRCDTIVNQPESARLQIIANYSHAHCYNAWYPVIDGDDTFAPMVNFDVSIKIPSNWYMIGSWVPKEYRLKPKSDGKYRMVRTYDNPYYCKIVAGDYNVVQGGNDKFKVWTYALKTSNCAVSEYAQFGTDFVNKLTEIYGPSDSGEYIIATQIGRKGNIQGIDGGYVCDQPTFSRSFNDEYLLPDIATTWVTSMTNPSENLPDAKVLSTGLASWLLLDHFESRGEGSEVLSKKINDFWTAHTPVDSPLTNPGCAFNDLILKTKAALVLRALKGWMGEEKFKTGFLKYFEKFKINGVAKPPRPTLANFKALMDEANGSPIDDFWKIYFESGSVPQPQAEVTRVKFEGKYIEKLRCKNLEGEGFPVNYRIFGLDGKTKDITFTGKEKEFDFEGGIAGLVNLSADALIPKPGLILNTLGAGTISAVLAWQKPVIVCLDSTMGERASQWAGLTGSNVLTEPLASLPNAPLICVGTNAALRYGQNSMKNLPIKNDGDSLTVGGVKIMGSFSTLMILPNLENNNLAMIIDTGAGTLPSDLTWSAIFEQKDGPNTYRFRNTADGQVSPPKPQVLDSGWTDKTQKVYDCRYDWNFSGVDSFKLAYNGFDPEKFAFGKIEKILDKSSNTGTAYLDLSKPTTLTLEKSDRFFGQMITEEFIYDGKSKNFVTPSGIVAPKSSTSDKYELKWTGQVKYMYQLDGVVSKDWDSGSSLLLTGLAAGSHRLKILFYSDGMLGKIQEYEFMAGQKPPKLELASKTAQCKNGFITIKGVTDPDATVEPSATIASNGSFEMTVKVDSCPKTLIIKATNKAGLETIQTITITSSHLIKITMQLGSSTATDESGNTYTLQVPPQKINGLTYVPMRFIGERLGAQILWDDATKKVTYILGSKVVEITIGKPEAIIDGKKVKMPGAAVIVGVKTLVPVRFVAEALGAKVGFEASTGTITIEYLGQ